MNRIHAGGTEAARAQAAVNEAKNLASDFLVLLKSLTRGEESLLPLARTAWAADWRKSPAEYSPGPFGFPQ